MPWLLHFVPLPLEVQWHAMTKCLLMSMPSKSGQKLIKAVSSRRGKSFVLRPWLSRKMIPPCPPSRDVWINWPGAKQHMEPPWSTCNRSFRCSPLRSRRDSKPGHGPRSSHQSSTSGFPSLLPHQRCDHGHPWPSMASGKAIAWHWHILCRLLLELHMNILFSDSCPVSFLCIFLMN